MQVRAAARMVRMSPRKVQLVVETIRGRPASEALAILSFAPQAAARAVWKVVRSAIANAENNYALDPQDLYVVSATADKGPSMPRRYRAKARGQAGMIEKKTTHITVVVDDEPGVARRMQQRGRPPRSR
jgi:large subunit ribosomal protein L22